MSEPCDFFQKKIKMGYRYSKIEQAPQSIEFEAQAAFDLPQIEYAEQNVILAVDVKCRDQNSAVGNIN